MTARTGRPVLPGLTGARGVAAWLVVLYHLRGGYAGQVPAVVSAAVDHGYLAVDFFFMLSGFVLWRNYAAPLRAGGAAAVPGFLWRRLARIWPLHATMLAAAVALAALLHATGRDARHFPWDTLPATILLMQNWGFTHYLDWNDPAWSISCEWAAYLLFAWAATRIDLDRRSRRWSVAAIVLIAATLHMLFAARGATTLGADIPRLGLPRALAEFAIGAILSTLHDRGGVSPPALLAIVATGTATLALGLPETLGVPLVLAAALLLMASYATMRGNPLATRVAVYLGEISYATYLFHFLGFVAFKLLFVTDADRIPAGTIGAFLLLTLVASVLLHHLVERPAQRALNGWRPVRRRVPRPAT